MNALRFYIRQSLLFEEVGQATWIRTQRKIIGGKEIETPQPAGEEETAFVKNLKAGITSLWTVGSAAIPARRGPGLLRAVSTAWASAPRGAVGAVAGVGAAAYALSGGNPSANEEQKSEATDAAADFYTKVVATVNKKMRSLSGALQTKDLATSTDDLATSFSKLEQNYKEKTDNLLVANSYDQFFSNFPGYTANVKGDLDTLITNTSQEAGKTETLKKFTYTYLIVHCADMIQTALGDDVKILESKGIRNDEQLKSKLQKVYEDTFDRISKDAEIKSARIHINEITGTR
jgi:hypothetical protein